MELIVNQINAGYRKQSVDQVVEEYVSQGYKVIGVYYDHIGKAVRLIKPESHRDYLLRNRHR